MSALTAEQDLKLHILATGVSIDPAAEVAWQETYDGPMSLNEYASTNGICFKIEEKGEEEAGEADGIYVNAPYTQEFARNADAQLRFNGRFVVVRAGVEFDVTVIPVPAYHSRTYIDYGLGLPPDNPDGKTHLNVGVEVPYTTLGVTHTDRVRISPIEGCGMTCMFCNIPFEFRHRYRLKPPEELLAVIGIAKDDEQTPARHVLISGGTPKKEDEPWEDALYENVLSNSPLPVDIMMTPREDKRYPDRLDAAGIHSLSVNIEVFDPQRAKKIIPHKNHRFGPDGYLDYIARAVNVLGVGRVQSLILFGESVEPLDSTLAGIQALVDRGCIPVLSQFRPDPRTPMANDPPSTEEEMKVVYEKTVEICEQSGSGVKPGPRCVPCHHNTVAFSDGSPFYVSSGDKY